MRSFILTLFFAVFLLSVEAQHFMKVAADPVITEDNKRCFLIKQGYSRKDTTQWVPYCGKLINFFYEQGYEYTLHVDKFDPSAPTIRVINTIGRDNSESYKKRLALKKRWEEEQTQSVQDQEQMPVQAPPQMENNTQTQPQIKEDYHYYYDADDYVEDDDEYDYDYEYDNDYEYDYY